MTDYTFIYCMMHDDGLIIEGNHTMRHCDNCEPCNWYNMGVIRYNGSTFDIVESVTVDYDRYGGGFMFIGYTDTYC